MRFGVSIFITDESDSPAELATMVESRGFESLWLPEHSHVPLDSADRLGREYHRIYDPFIALASAATATSRLRIGTAVSLISIRDPIWTSKMVATLDHVSEGRFDFGVGYGWIQREVEDHHVSFNERRELFRDNLRIMRALWTQDVATYEGIRGRLDESLQWPKPVQRPHPPIYIGAGLGPKTLADILEFSDGWMPLGRFGLRAHDVDQVRQEYLEANGKQPSILLYESATDSDRLRRLQNLGCDQIIFRLRASTLDAVGAELSSIEAVIESV